MNTTTTRFDPALLPDSPTPVKPERTRNAPKLETVGSAVVKIYGTGPYTITWRETAKGPRKATMRATLKKAKDFAHQVATDLANGQTQMLAFTEADRAADLAARQNLAGTGQSLVSATAEHARRERILAAKQITFDSLIECWDQSRPRIAAPRPLPTVVDEYLAERSGQISTDHHAHRSHQLHKLAAYYTGPMHCLQRVDVEIWLRSLGVGPITRRGYYEAARELVRYAEACGYIRPDHPLLKKTKAPARVAREIRILSIEQVTDLLRIRQHAEELGRAQKSLVPFLAIQLFAGLRHSEAARLDWRDVHLEERSLYVPKAIGKGTRDRHVPISDNLAAWLLPYARRSGPITSLAQISGAITKAKQQARIPAGENETRNILRKTFISYRKAMIQNVAQVAEEAGNSVGIIHKHYGRPIPQAEGRRLFDIWPTAAEVLQLNFNLA